MKALIAALLISAAMHTAAGDAQSRQDQLDAKCEAARQKVIAPARAKYIDECVRDKMKESREDCERFYRDYGERSGRRPALYYDLPDCVAAYEFRERSHNAQ
jgi:hypothetical protein